MPLSEDMPADNRASRIAAARNPDSTPVLDPSAICASASERDAAIVLSDRRSLPRATDSSIILAMKMVQVASEAHASPIITAFTITSAERNIDHGERSCGTRRVDFSAAPASGVDAAGAAGAEGAAVTGGAACAFR